MLMAYTRDPSTACTHQQRDALLWSPTRDDEQSGRDCFVCHVGQTGTLTSEAGPGVLPGFNRSEGIAQSVCWRHPAHSGKRTRTTAARIDVASKTGPRTVFTKRSVTSGPCRPGV